MNQAGPVTERIAIEEIQREYMRAVQEAAQAARKAVEEDE